jgi:hypothetical protein
VALPAVGFAVVFPSRFHFPAPLGSTVVTRFIATTGTLTPAPLPSGQVSLVPERALPGIPSPTTPCAPADRPCFWFRAGLASDSLFPAIGGSSDFVHCSQSHQSHRAESSLCRGASWSLSSTDCPFTSSCSPHHVAMTQLLSVTGGKLRRGGTFTLRCAFHPKRTSADFPVRSTP